MHCWHMLKDSGCVFACCKRHGYSPCEAVLVSPGIDVEEKTHGVMRNTELDMVHAGVGALAVLDEWVDEVRKRVEGAGL